MTKLRTAAALLTLGTAFAGRAQSAATPAPEAPTAPAAAAPAPKTTLSGKIFADYTFQQNIDGGADRARGTANGTAFDLKRAYVTVDHAFDPTFGARIRTDVTYSSATKNVEVFAKHAYLEGKFAPELVVRAGAADLPWVPFVEELYGLRFVEGVVADRTRFATSADWGLHLGGKLGGGIASYAVSVVNGRGYKDPTRSQAPTVEGRVSVTPVKGLTLAVGGLAGKLGQNVIGTKTPNTAIRAQALVAYVDGAIRVGVEGFYARDDSTAAITGGAEDEALGGSLWASYAVLPALNVFGRLDLVQPKRDTNSSLEDRYFSVGASFEVAKPLDVALVYKHEQVSNDGTGTLSSANGDIGSSVAGHSGKYDEVGLFAQYSF